MNRPLLISLAALAALAVALVVVAVRRAPPGESPAATTSAGSGQTVTITQSKEEIFRRAFWRHATSADRIVHADRREWTETGGTVQRWQWFLQVQPGPDLLRALRDPDTFGLARVSTASASAATAPAWFPATERLAGCEILQTPGGGLTVCYRASDNTLFATDSGRGFAPPVTAVASR